MGAGKKATQRKASREVAHWTPNLLYRAGAKSGKTAPQMDRKKVLTAMALFA